MKARPLRSAACILSLLAIIATACSDGGTGTEASARPLIRIAAASDLQFALDEIIGDFAEVDRSITVEASYGSSGTFFEQLQNGAPFDLFLSADISYPDRLVEEGLALEGSRFRYAVGRIVVWVPNGSAVDVEREGIEVLLDPVIDKVAIADPAHAPYGKAAIAALEHAGIADAVEAKLVLGESVAQAAQFAESGAADAGIVALSLALVPPLSEEGSSYEIPLDTYPRIDQGGVILEGADVGPTRAFVDFLLGPRGSAVLERYGFFLPET